MEISGEPTAAGNLRNSLSLQAVREGDETAVNTSYSELWL